MSCQHMTEVGATPKVTGQSRRGFPCRAPTKVPQFRYREHDEGAIQKARRGASREDGRAPGVAVSLGGRPPGPRPILDRSGHRSGGLSRISDRGVPGAGSRRDATLSPSDPDDADPGLSASPRPERAGRAPVGGLTAPLSCRSMMWARGLVAARRCLRARVPWVPPTVFGHREDSIVRMRCET